MILITGISELLTLKPAADKKGRRPTVADLGIVKDAALLIDGDRIQWAGARADFNRANLELKNPALNNLRLKNLRLKNLGLKNLRLKNLQHLKLKNQVVLPGFVECHTHAIFAGSRSAEFEMRLNGASYQEISKAGGGILSTVTATRAATPSALLRHAQNAVTAFARQGVTTLEIKSGYGLSEKEELRILKLIRKLKGPEILSTYLGPHGKSPEHKTLDSYVNEIIHSTLPKIAKLKLADRVDMFVDEGFFSVAQAELYLAAAQRLNLPAALHAHQLGRTGAVDVAIAQGAYSAEHLIQLNASDIKKLAHSDVACVLLPTADLYTGLDYPPARALIDAGAVVALATDFNPGTAPACDLTLVGLLARLQMKMSLAEVICSYTVGGSHALRTLDETGSLEAGKRANFVVLEGHWSELFYAVGSNPVQQTWVSGKKLKLS